MKQLWSPWRMEYILSNKQEGCVFCDALGADVSHDTETLILHRGAFCAVVMNLYHPEVAQLLALCERAPELAGHYGLAMALTDPNQPLLRHLSQESREDLIQVDAMAKLLGDEADAPDRFEGDDRTLRDFLRNRLSGFFSN